MRRHDRKPFRRYQTIPPPRTPATAWVFYALTVIAAMAVPLTVWAQATQLGYSVQFVSGCRVLFMVTCPTGPEVGPFTEIMCAVERQFSFAFGGLICKITEAVKEPVSAAIILSIAISGLQFAIGQTPITIGQWMMRLVIIALVAIVALNAPLIAEVIYATSIRWTRAIIEMVTTVTVTNNAGVPPEVRLYELQPGTGVVDAGSSCNSKDYFNFDCIFDQIFFHKAEQKDGITSEIVGLAMALLFLPGGTTLLPMLGALTTFAAYSFARYAMAYLFVITMLTFLSAVMGIFLVFFLFQPLKPLANAAVSYMIMLILQLPLLFGFVKLVELHLPYLEGYFKYHIAPYLYLHPVTATYYMGFFSTMLYYPAICDVPTVDNLPADSEFTPCRTANIERRRIDGNWTPFGDFTFPIARYYPIITSLLAIHFLSEGVRQVQKVIPELARMLTVAAIRPLKFAGGGSSFGGDGESSIRGLRLGGHVGRPYRKHLGSEYSLTFAGERHLTAAWEGGRQGWYGQRVGLRRISGGVQGAKQGFRDSIYQSIYGPYYRPLDWRQRRRRKSR